MLMCEPVKVLRRALWVCCSPVLSEGSEAGDLQDVCIWLVVFLVNDSPCLLPPILLHHLLNTEHVAEQVSSCCVLPLMVTTKVHSQHKHTCPSTIHLDMTVLPSEPGQNLSVAVRGLMLEMTRLEGAPGSSANRRKYHQKDHLFQKFNLKSYTSKLYTAITHSDIFHMISLIFMNDVVLWLRAKKYLRK